MGAGRKKCTRKMKNRKSQLKFKARVKKAILAGKQTSTTSVS